jgi:putative SOS response-associated peptidase YedK
VIESCTIITLPANPLMARIHNARQRMPAILAKEDRTAWLEGSPDEAFVALRQYPDTHMIAYPVSTNVNRPANNNPSIIAEIKID